MGKYIIKRLGETVLTILLISLFCFFLLQLMPGDPVYKILGEDAEPYLYDQVEEMYGFDQPLIVQYWNWLKGILFHWDFGMSYKNYESVTEMINARLPVTIFLAALSIAISSVIGILLGIVTAVKRGSLIDQALTTVANVISSAPNFWIGVILMYVFSIKLQLTPLYGFDLPWKPNVNTVKALQQMILPLTCMSLGSIAGTMRQTRSAVLEVIRQDYIRTARSKGLSSRTVIFKHALKNAFVPIITIIGMRMSALVGGSAFVEQVFLIPGMGTLLITAVNQGNIPVIMACVMLISLVAGLSNLVVDLLYGVVDPRIRLN